jgi:multiple sugar transport system ATP-binding protein
VDLQIEDGEFFTFVGPSGCGKSTLLNLIAGVDAASAGRIRFDDRDVAALAPGDRDIAMVFQSYALYPHLTVRENIGFPLRVRGRPRGEIAREVERVARTLGLSELLDRKPRQLSGGQRQRVALGRALVRRPAAFLMDEPLSNLDAGLRLEMRAEIKRLHAAHGITTIYVTHDQEEAMVLSDRLAVLEAGSIRQCGRPQAVYDDPDNLFVARFLGTPPINVLEAGALAGLAPFAAPRTPPGPGRQSAAATPTRAGLLAIRPGQVTVGVEPGRDALPARVLMTEPTGDDLWVIAELAGQRVRGRAAAAASLQPGADVSLTIDAASVLWFDEATGARVRTAFV